MCIRRWSEMKRLTLSKIRGRWGEIAETVHEREKEEKRVCRLGLRHYKALLLSIRHRLFPPS